MATLEQRADDIRAVMDAVGIDSAIIWGQSEGASRAAMFAATHPARAPS
jgi:pimeloyl-ACP methyl ester carboxylesterase